MSLTCVSCYFPVKNKHKNAYNVWFFNSLAVNCPYVFFTDKESLETIRMFRGSLPTHYIVCTLQDFYMYRYKHRMVAHPTHSPSVELNLIWTEKLFMMQQAVELNPFRSTWFKWIDAGICTFRDVRPSPVPFMENPQNLVKLAALPQDKFIYCSSEGYDPTQIRRDHYYHHVSGTFMFHASFLPGFMEVYKDYVETLVDKNNIWTEQVILTHMLLDKPELFHKLSDGYGAISHYLFSA